MYKLLLTSRYLRRKMIPIFALLAVTLCTAMVIIVISVMGGFLEMVKTSGRTLMGDVSLYAGLSGFTHYQELVAELEALPEADAATSIVVAYGLVKIDEQTKGVQIYGIDGPKFDRVTLYRDTLVWNRDLVGKHPSVRGFFGADDPIEAGVALRIPGEAEAESHAMTLGLEVSMSNIRRKDGSYDFPAPMPGQTLTVTLLPVTTKGGVSQPETERFTVVNEFKSGVYDVDSQRVYIPFRIAQRMMLMDEARLVDPDDPSRVIGTVPARATEVHVRAAEGVTAEQLQKKVRDVYIRMLRKHSDLTPYMSIETWEGRQKHFLRAVENEKGLMTFLFAIISVVAIVMVGVIFHMIVFEKTRDIGILRAVGASQPGIASIFLVYGGMIGAVGATLGCVLAFGVVHNINEIHAWLGDGLGWSVFHFGIPAGAMVLWAIGGAAWVAIDNVFRRGKPFNVAAMSAIGLLGALVGGVGWLAAKALFLREGHTIDGAAFAWALGGGPVIAAAAMFVLAGLYWVIERFVPGSSRRRIAVMAGVGAVAGVAAVLIWRAADAKIAETVNDAISVQIWDRSVYFFDRIPNRLDWREMLVFAIAFVLASVLGALIPAIRAAMVDPVESLRYE